MDATFSGSKITRSAGRALHGFTLLCCLVGTGMSLLGVSSARASAVSGAPRRVMALYYPWYGTPKVSGKWHHQNGVDHDSRTMTSHTHYPLSGPYDSTDPAVIDRHLREAKSAGIDTLVCSWWGRNDPTDKAIRLLLKQAPKHGMTVCIFWEPNRPVFTPKTAHDDLTYILRTFAQQPGYLHHGNTPVVFLYSKTSQRLPVNQWAGVLNTVSRENRPGVVAITDDPVQANGFPWGGSYALEQLMQMNGLNPEQSAQALHQAFLPRLPRQMRSDRPIIETIGPGYDDRPYNANAGIGPGLRIDRQFGQRYRRLWEQTLQDAPDWVLIDSFNEWHNGTEIEPSRETGDGYLQMTRTFAQRFKSANRTSPTRPGTGAQRLTVRSGR